MDFFDKLSKKATETYQVAKEKTSNISEEIKLKAKVNNLEEKNYQIFAEIGEIVYNELVAGRDVDREQIMAKTEVITTNKNEMEKLKLQILEVKNMKKCVNCGNELNKDAEFCSKCGAAQPKEEKAEVVDSNDAEDKKEE